MAGRMTPRWVPYVVFGLAVIPVALAAHLRGSVTTNDLALISVSLTVTVVMFSVYLFHRQAFLQDARNSDMQALRHDLYSQSGTGSPDGARRVTGYFLILSEDYRRVARVRTYMSLLLIYATVAMVLALILSVSYPGTIYWISPYFVGTFFFGSAVIARLQNLGFSGCVPAVEWLTPTGVANAFRGTRKVVHLMFPARNRLVTERLELDGWGPFLRQLESEPDPNTLREPWKSE